MLLDDGSPDTMSATSSTQEVLAPTTVSGTTGGGVAGTTADYVVVQEQPDTKEGIEELCPVCGDKVSGYHYGLLTCESCKGFFKRTVQNKKVYTCVAERSCHIDKSQRKRCPYCRFQKCLDVGMKLEAVRADRMRGGRNKFGPMYKRDRARKLQLLRQKQITGHGVGSGGSTGSLGGNSNGMGGGRSTCQMGGSEVQVVGTVGGPAMPYNSSGAGGAPLYHNGHVQIKQELIQIPQLSSSTSSPDSSPSPLCILTNGPASSLHGHHGQQQSHHHLSQQQQQQHHHQQQQLQQQQQQQHHSQQQQQHHTVHEQQQQQHKMASSSSTSTWTPHTPSTPTSSTPSPQRGAGAASPPDAPAPSYAASAAGGDVAAVVGVNAASSVGRVPALIREIQTATMDDKEWQSNLFGLLQHQTYNQCEVDLFELMCKVLDQSLFAQVDWARNSLYFKDLKVDDQMKLLQHSWSDMLLLDNIHHRLHNSLPDETTLANGQKFDLLELAVLGHTSLIDNFTELSGKLDQLKFDSIDYICLKFLLLLNPDVRALVNRKHIHESLEQVKQALLEYNINCYPQIQDKFGKLMMMMSEIHSLSLRGEEFLYCKHVGGSAPTQTLLMEMLHAKKK